MRHGENAILNAYLELEGNKSGFRQQFPIPSLFPDLKTDHSWGEATDRKVQEFLSGVARRMRSNLLRPDDHADPSDEIPAGYTYLLQLIFHDVSRSSFSTGAGKAINLNSPTLDLDTLYKTDCETDLDLYESPDGSMPPYLFKLGPMLESALSVPAGHIPRCPFDFARTGDSHTSSQIFPVAADNRNDDHSILSQLSVLFKIVHNHVATALKNEGDSNLLAFQKAKSFIVDSYRSIVLNDVLKRVLGNSQFEKYFSNGFDFSEYVDHDCKLTPIEFSFGVSRFGHAMARPSYIINELFANASNRPTSQGGLDGVIARSSFAEGEPHKIPLPLIRHWAVDWRFFFELENTPGLNRARRISPLLAFPLSELPLRDALDATSRKLLASMDMDRCIRLKMPTGQQLARKLRLQVLTEEQMKPSSINAYGTLESWQLDLENYINSNGFYKFWTETPLTYYIMQEAAILGRNGRHLGPVGAFILSYTISNALKNSKVSNSKEIQSSPVSHSVNDMSKFIGLLSMDDTQISELVGQNQREPIFLYKKVSRLNEAGE